MPQLQQTRNNLASLCMLNAKGGGCDIRAVAHASACCAIIICGRSHHQNAGSPSGMKRPICNATYRKSLVVADADDDVNDTALDLQREGDIVTAMATLWGKRGWGGTSSLSFA